MPTGGWGTDEWWLKCRGQLLIREWYWMKVFYLCCWQTVSPCGALLLEVRFQFVHLLLSQLGYLSWISPSFSLSLCHFLSLVSLMLHDMLESHSSSACLSSTTGNYSHFSPHSQWPFASLWDLMSEKASNCNGHTCHMCLKCHCATWELCFIVSPKWLDKLTKRLVAWPINKDSTHTALQLVRQSVNIF